MKKLVLHLPLAVGLVSAVTPLMAPLATAATVTLNQVSGSSSCGYTSIFTDANGNLTVTCSGSTPTAAPPAGTPAPPPAGTPAPPPAGTPAPPPTTAPPPPGNCPATPTNAREIIALSKPPNGGTFPSGQEHYNNPATTTSDGTIGSNQILVVPFMHNGNTGTTRATAGPGNYGGVSSFQMAISKCPGSFDPAYFATADNQYCERKRDNAPTIYFQYCAPTIGSQYYVNIKPVSAQEANTAFVFNFN